MTSERFYLKCNVCSEVHDVRFSCRTPGAAEAGRLRASLASKDAQIEALKALHRNALDECAEANQKIHELESEVESLISEIDTLKYDAIGV